MAWDQSGIVLLPDSGGQRSDHPRTASRYAAIARRVAVTDALSLDAAVVATRLLREGFRPVGTGFLVLLVLAPVIWVAIFAGFQLYTAPRLAPAEEFRRVLEATGVAVVVKVFLVTLGVRSALSVLSRQWVGLTWVVALVLVFATRQAWHKYMGRVRARGGLSFRTLILGANEEALTIAEALLPRRSGYLPVGMVETGQRRRGESEFPVLGSADHLDALIDRYAIECVFVASSACHPELMKQVTKELRRRSIEIRVSANITEILSSRLTVNPVGDLLALTLRPVRLSGAQAALKRTFDIAVGSVIALVSMPVWLVCAAAIKLTSRGPVLYRQERVGRHGGTFTMYKFRTMVRGAELLLPGLLHRNEASGPLFKISDDPRITRAGRWLRRWSLDELPQLLNVLKGDMSLVGPRPPLAKEVALYEDWHRGRLEVRPGMTGLWQVRGRSQLGFDEYVRLDLFYIENWSIAYDVFILAKTVPAVLFHHGAY